MEDKIKKELKEELAKKGITDMPENTLEVLSSFVGKTPEEIAQTPDEEMQYVSGGNVANDAVKWIKNNPGKTIGIGAGALATVAGLATLVAWYLNRPDDFEREVQARLKDKGDPNFAEKYFN